MQNLQLELIGNSLYPSQVELDKVYSRLTFGELLLNSRVEKPKNRLNNNSR